MFAEGATKTPVLAVLDQSLGHLRLDPGRTDQPVVGIDVHPRAAAAAQELAALGCAIEVLVPEAAGEDVPAALAGAMNVPATFHSTAGFAAMMGAFAGDRNTTGKPGVFVAADRVRRAEAARLGYNPVSHLALAPAAVRGEAISFAQLTGGRDAIASLPDLLPYYFEHQPDGLWTCLAAVPQSTLASAALQRLRFAVLPLDIGTEDPLLVQLDDANQGDLAAFAALRLLAADGQRVLVAVAADQSTDDIAFHGAHGHFLHLAPSPGLLLPPPAVATAMDMAAGETGLAAAAPTTCPATAAEYAAIVDRYSGASDPGGGPIVSRHAAHPDNQRAVEVLVAELRDLGYCATTHPFTYGGRTLRNVIADLPGKGIATAAPDARDRVRELLLTTPLANGGMPAELAQAASLTNLATAAFGSSDSRQVRAAVEQAAGLYPWQAWWLRDCPLPGVGAELVIVGCHLDSTANRDNPGFDPKVDPSPGKDDDASGVGGVLAIARQLASLRNTLTHTVRFCFFNAEEHGLVGSREYAEAMKVAGAPIRAVVCLDMIGFNNDTSRTFEIHAGFPTPAIRDLSLPIAQRIADAALSQGVLPPAQIYRGLIQGGPTDHDRDMFDGAIGRSDHAAFQEQGYAGVVVTEDFFVNRPQEDAAEPNPNYHSRLDTVIDSAYAADIVCAAAQAIKELAA